MVDGPTGRASERDEGSPRAQPDPRLEIRRLGSPRGGGDRHEATTETLDLKALLDQQRVQEIMDDFHALTGMVTAILDLQGNVLESTGWRELCTRFHRAHPVTARNCTESDLALASGLKPGQYADYRCKNGLRDVVTPLYIRGRHIGNIFTGQFFYDDDVVDEAVFARQAEVHGFAEEPYLRALRAIPRYSRETIGHLMSFLVRMTEHISQIGLANLELAEEGRIRQQAETGWHDSRAHLRAVVRAMPDLVWMKDPDGVYLLCNRRFEQFLGAPESAILGKTDADFLPADLVESFRSNDLRAIERGVPTLNIEDVRFAEDGHVETLETVKTPICDEDGRVLGVLGIGRDITARLQAERTLRENEARLREAQRLESIGRLAAGISHDLNNLLTPILGYAEIVAGQFSPADPNAESLAQITYAGKRARDLVSQLMAFGRQQALEYRTVDLNAVVSRLEKLLRHSLRENVRLQFELAGDTPQVRADQGQIERVIMNLALNAADAMPNGGDLLVATAATSPPVATNGAADARHALLSVQDTGIGMDVATVNRIFEPFFSTKGELGTGLGLATVHGIVKQHGGDIQVDSEPGRGTTFRVYPPALGPGTSQPGPHVEVDEPVVDAVTTDEPAVILLAEDHEGVRALVTHVLGLHGYRVLAAESGEAALRLLEMPRAVPDLLLTDMVMPGMSGMDLRDRVLARIPGLPVLFMSGYTDMAFSVPDGHSRLVRFVRKPFQGDSLIALVHELLAERKRTN